MLEMGRSMFHGYDERPDDQAYGACRYSVVSGSRRLLRLGDHAYKDLVGDCYQARASASRPEYLIPDARIRLLAPSNADRKDV